MMNNANELSRSARVLPRRYGVIDQCLVDAGYFKKLVAFPDGALDKTS